MKKIIKGLTILALSSTFLIGGTFNLNKFAETIGPVAFIHEKGVILYEGKTRVCIK